MRPAYRLVPFSVVLRLPRTPFYTWGNRAGSLLEPYPHIPSFVFCCRIEGSESIGNYSCCHPCVFPRHFNNLYLCSKRLDLIRKTGKPHKRICLLIFNHNDFHVPVIVVRCKCIRNTVRQIHFSYLGNQNHIEVLALSPVFDSPVSSHIVLGKSALL